MTASPVTREASTAAPRERPRLPARRGWPARRSVGRPAPTAGLHSGPPRHRLAWVGVHLAAQTAFLLLLRALSPRFFFVDDQQAQYLPMFAWMGRNLSDGRPPLLAPEQGAAGNLVADAQYGVYDPVHWLIGSLVSTAEDVNNAAWLLGSVPVFLLGLGVLTLLRSYGVARRRWRSRQGWGCRAPASSCGSARRWWPLMWSAAFLPWLWYGLATSRWIGVPVTGAAAYLLASAGYPYNLLFAVVTVVAVLVERWIAGGLPALRSLDVLARCAAGLGGLLAALPGLLSVAQMLPYTTRGFPSTALGNPGMFVPNLVDVLLGGATLTPSISEFWFGNLVWAPVAATAAFAVPAVALVDWRQVLSPAGRAHRGGALPDRRRGDAAPDVRRAVPAAVALPGRLPALPADPGRPRAALRVPGSPAAASSPRSRSPGCSSGWRCCAPPCRCAGTCSPWSSPRSPSRRWPVRPRRRPGSRRLAAAGLVLTTLGAAVLSERAATALDNRFQTTAGTRCATSRPATSTRATAGPSTSAVPLPRAGAAWRPGVVDGIDPTVLAFSGPSDPKGAERPAGRLGHRRARRQRQPVRRRAARLRLRRRRPRGVVRAHLLRPLRPAQRLARLRRPRAGGGARHRPALGRRHGDRPGAAGGRHPRAARRLLRRRVGPAWAQVGAFTAYARRSRRRARVAATRGDVTRSTSRTPRTRPAYGGQALGRPGRQHRSGAAATWCCACRGGRGSRPPSPAGRRGRRRRGHAHRRPAAGRAERRPGRPVVRSGRRGAARCRRSRSARCRLAGDRRGDRGPATAAAQPSRQRPR